MAYAKAQDYDLGLVLGRFTETSHGKPFEYCRRTEDAGDWAADFPHLVCVNDVIGWPYRFAKVLKTVAYVVTDEDASGVPIVQKWQIKSHRIYRNN